MRLVRIFGLACLTMMLAATLALSQETETKVVDEVVAQINDGVITLSGIRREIKNVIDTEVQRG